MALKEGPVHDVQWSPSGQHFMVVAGFMPAKTILFDARCESGMLYHALMDRISTLHKFFAASSLAPFL